MPLAMINPDSKETTLAMCINVHHILLVLQNDKGMRILSTKRSIFVIGLLALALLSTCKKQDDDSPTTPDGTDDGILKVAFIGNSHTYYHDLPNTVKQITISSGFSDSILVAVAAPGGYSLEEHAAYQPTLDLLKAEHWDWVILQENASRAALAPNEAEMRFFPFVQQIKNLLRSQNSETKLLLYLTHAYQEGTPDCTARPDICTYEQMQNQIRRNYVEIGDRLGIGIAPAGIMWKILLEREELPLWNEDTIHPSPLGSYVSALTIYAIMQEQSLKDELYTPSFVEPDHKTLILEVINQSIFEDMPDWRSF